MGAVENWSAGKKLSQKSELDFKKLLKMVISEDP